MCNAFGTVRQHRGYTLVELLIVVAILAMVLSLAWPSMRKLSQKGQLRDAARQLRVQLLQARLDAIRSGSVRLFRYQPGTGCYEVSDASDFRSADRLGLIAPEGAVNGDRLPRSGPNGDASATHELAGGAVFLDPRADAPVGPAADMAAAEVSEAWSGPIIFYPNGRTLNARFRLASTHYAVDLSLRGLTGTVALGEVQRLETRQGEHLEDL